jgi:hypothetical protein
MCRLAWGLFGLSLALLLASCDACGNRSGASAAQDASSSSSSAVANATADCVTQQGIGSGTKRLELRELEIGEPLSWEGGIRVPLSHRSDDGGGAWSTLVVSSKGVIQVEAGGALDLSDPVPQWVHGVHGAKTPNLMRVIWEKGKRFIVPIVQPTSQSTALAPAASNSDASASAFVGAGRLDWPKGSLSFFLLDAAQSRDAPKPQAQVFCFEPLPTARASRLSIALPVL